MSGLFPTLKIDPIVEAQLTLVFNSENQVEENPIQTFLQSTGYSNLKPLMRASFKLEQGKAETEHTTLGHRAEYGNFVLQCTNNTFSLSEINKYSSWRTTFNETQRGWKEFSKFFAILNVSQVSVRYINRLQLPCAISHASEYWKSANTTLSSPLGTINEYFSKVGFSFPNSEVKALLVQMLDNKPAPPGHINLLVDILTMVQTDFKADSADLWASFEKLRECKNLIFFDNLTDKALELYR